MSQEQRRRFLLGLGTCVAIVVAILLLFRNYFGVTLLYGDSNLQWEGPLLGAAVTQLGHAWAPAFGGGRPSIIFNESTAPLTVLQALLSVFGMPLSTMLVYPFLLCVAYAGAWIAARKISGNAFGAHVVAAFFIGNPWIWDRILLGHIAILSATAVTAWVVATIAYRAELGRAFAPLMFAACGLLLACDPRIAYMGFVGLFVLAIFWFVRFARGRVAADAWRAGTLVLAPFVALLLNAWWSLPFLTMPGINPVREHFPPLEDVLSYSRYSDPAHNLVFSGSFLQFSWERAHDGGWLAFGLWYIAVVAVVLLALTSRPRSAPLGWILRAGVVASLLISLGTTLFPSEAALWVYRNVPFALLFRDPNKLGFVAIVCCAVLLCVRLRGAASWQRVAIAGVVAIAVLPATTGVLRTADGTGLQAFSTQPDYANVLTFLRAQPSFPAFRLGIVPPWTAEVSLAGDHPVAEPFVFQYDVPTMDAKLINVASDTNMQAWRVYSEIYQGRDPHAGADLARLGVKYLLWDDRASLSAGAANTPFANVSNVQVGRAVEALRFPQVFRSGPLHVYENPEAGPLLRTLSGPVVAGAVPEALRAALPASLIGDTIETLDAGPLPFPTVGIGAGRADACRSQAPRAAIVSAYDRASGRADWTANWVDSDYLQQGTGDPYLARQLEAYPLPYAFTESNAIATFPLDVPRDGRIATSGAVLATPASVAYAIDGGPWKPLAFGATLRWVELDRVAPGPHVVTIRGSRVGTVLRGVTAAPVPRCFGPFLDLDEAPARVPRAGGWALPTPISMLTVKRANGRFAFEATNVTAVTRGPIAGPGADAITIDGHGVADGKRFPVLTGFHAVEFYAVGASLTTVPWAHFVHGAPTGEAPSATFDFSKIYAEDGAAATLTGVPIGSTVVLKVPFAGDPTGAEVRIFQNNLVIERYALQRVARYLAFTAYSDTIIIAVHRQNVSTALRLLPFRAYSGVAVAESTLDLPGRAVAIAPGRTFALARRPVASPVDLTFAPDDRAAVPVDSIESYVTAHGAGALFSYRGLRASRAVSCTIVVTFETERGPVRRALADIAIGTNGSNGSIDLGFLPRTSALLPRFECDDTSQVLSASKMRLAFYRDPARATVVSAPERPVEALRPVAVASRAASPEAYEIQGHPAAVVSLSSFDPAWQFESNRHLVANGVSNAWIDAGGSHVTYAVQAVYERYLWLSALCWLALAGAAFVTLRRR